VGGVADACKNVEKRRSEEVPSGLSRFNEVSTANNLCLEPRKANDTGKFSVITAWFREHGVGLPESADVVGVGAGGAIQPLQAWNPKIKLQTYDATRQRQNDHKFTVWKIHQDYPHTSDLLIDDSYGEGVAGVKEAMAAKCEKIAAAGYEHVCVKFYLTSDVKTSFAPLRLPNQLEILGSCYSQVTIVAPTRSHSPEIYFMGTGFVGIDGNKDGPARLIAPLYAKVILMDIANRFRKVLLRVGHITSFSAIYPRAQLPKLYPELLAYTGFGAYTLPVLTTMEKFIVGATVNLRDDVGEDVVDLDDFFTAPPRFEPDAVDESFRKAMQDDVHEQRTRKRASMEMMSIVSPGYMDDQAPAPPARKRAREVPDVEATKPRDGNLYPQEEAGN